MRNIQRILCSISIFLFFAISCSKSENQSMEVLNSAVQATFGNNIDLNNLEDYAGQGIPFYIAKDNTGPNPISNIKATIGRVLFYDKSLSINNTIACASCHKQEFAFSDSTLVSSGVLGGLTQRHSMRLVNVRFATERRFFWDERAANLEQQTTQPIRDHAEMGFSGQNGRPDFNALLVKLQSIKYYNELFKIAFTDTNITEIRIQECLAQFIRSIQSFDSKYDEGRAQVANNNQNFPNFTANENMGKALFQAAPVFNENSSRVAGGLGCNACHNAPEFDIDPNSRNNGIIGVANSVNRDFTNTRAPSLRDLTNINRRLNTRLMHTGLVSGIRGALDHYNQITLNQAQNPNLDPRLAPNGIGQKLNMTEAEITAVVSFLETLAGKNIYTDKKWSNPFL